MKRPNIKIAYLLLSLFSIFSCTKLDTDFLEEESETCVKVETRTSEGEEIPYPLYLFAFDETGKQVSSITYEDSEDNERNLMLSSGTYRIVALAGIDECTLPTDKQLNSFLILPKKNYLLENPLMMGSAGVTITDTEATVNLLLSHRMSRIGLSLGGIPENVTAVRVRLSSLPNGMDFEGNYSEERKETIVECVLSETDKTVWVAPVFYVFPNVNDLLTLSIELSDEFETLTYGYTFPKKIEAGIPYVLEGNYLNGFTVNGNLVVESWGTVENFRFTFGNNSASDSDDESEDEIAVDVFTVQKLPTACSVWNDHVVVALQNATSSEADLLLLSRDEWTNISSATGQNPSQAAGLAVQYAEESLSTGWHIPTKEEAKLITASCASEALLANMNTLLSEVDGELLVSSLSEDEKGNPVRYLCNEAMNTYTVGRTGNQSAAGKSRTYSLRFVKIVHVVLQLNE